jgi:glyoxylase I family protein
MIKIKLTSIMVDDQAKALAFYTDVLGFQKKQDFPVGDARWITVTAPGRDDLELALEPNGNPAALAFTKSLFEQGIPLTAFECDDVTAEYERMSKLGVAFTQKPEKMGPVMIAVFADTCGNLIQIYQRV